MNGLILTATFILSFFFMPFKFFPFLKMEAPTVTQNKKSSGKHYKKETVMLFHILTKPLQITIAAVTLFH